jgi:ferrous iron transport protein B
MPYTVALIGNPNVGKSVIFNNLVPGARQHVGNWPGKTVEKKEGWCTHRGEKLKIVDLPGTYSLTARAIDELIARNYIVDNRPDVVVDIVDASNIERNLYLTFLLAELEANVVVALNMFDIAEGKGYKIDVKRLSELVGFPMIPTVATKKKGMEQLKDAILEAAYKSKTGTISKIHYGKGVEELIIFIVKILEKDETLAKKYPLRWLAIKLLEKDEDALTKIQDSEHRSKILEAIA